MTWPSKIIILIVILGSTINLIAGSVSENIRWRVYHETMKNEDWAPGGRAIEKNGERGLISNSDWKTGFTPGTLRELSGYFPEARTAWNSARKRLKGSSLIAGTHDLGFMLFLALDPKSPEDLPFLKAGGALVSARFSEKTGAIKAWDHKKWEFPVIIDTMANLDILRFDGSRGKQVAQTHADTTWRLLVRPNGSTRHKAQLNSKSGKTIHAGTHQGLHDQSTWARGQAWAVYGWASLSEWLPEELPRAEHLASWSLANTKGKIPLWDYAAPETDPRDESSAAILAAGYAKLYILTKNEVYKKGAIEMLKALLDRPKTSCTQSWTSVHWIHTMTPEGAPYADYYALKAANLLDASRRELFNVR